MQLQFSSQQIKTPSCLLPPKSATTACPSSYNRILWLEESHVLLVMTTAISALQHHPTTHAATFFGTHLLRSLWMIGWVRLCRYSMPLATSMAMMSLDCRSISLSIDTSLKKQPLSTRSMVPDNHTHHLIQINRTVYKDSTWPHSQWNTSSESMTVLAYEERWENGRLRGG